MTALIQPITRLQILCNLPANISELLPHNAVAFCCKCVVFCCRCVANVLRAVARFLKFSCSTNLVSACEKTIYQLDALQQMQHFLIPPRSPTQATDKKQPPYAPHIAQAHRPHNEQQNEQQNDSKHPKFQRLNSEAERGRFELP